MAKFTYPEDNEINELNKCPDCGSFFSTLYCPICGKYCPEEMRAGARKKQTPYYDRKPVKGATNTPFYLKWWFILIVSFFSKILAIVLTCMTDWKKWVKVIIVILLLLPYLISYFFRPYILLLIQNYVDKYYNENPPQNITEKDVQEEVSAIDEIADFGRWNL